MYTHILFFRYTETYAHIYLYSIIYKRILSDRLCLYHKLHLYIDIYVPAAGRARIISIVLYLQYTYIL